MKMGLRFFRSCGCVATMPCSYMPSTCWSWTAFDLRREPIEVRKQALANLLHSKSEVGLQLNEHFHETGEVIFRHACKLGCEGIVSKRLGSRYRSGRSPDWLKMKNPNAPAVQREAEEDWGRDRW